MRASPGAIGPGRFQKENTETHTGKRFLPVAWRLRSGKAYRASHFFQESIGPVTGVVFDW